MLIFFLIAGCIPICGIAEQPLDLSPVNKWLDRMMDVQSVEATFVQQKYLRTLRSPLTTRGRLWLRYPDWFRWEIGEPPSTVAIRDKDIVTVLKPKKKQAERFSLSPKEGAKGPSVPASIRSVSKTFPRSMAELEKHFEIVSIERDGKIYELALKPKDKKLTVALRQVVFFIDADKYHLHGFELQFRDKSRIRTTFTKQQFNLSIPAGLLKPDLNGYKVTDRLK